MDVIYALAYSGEQADHFHLVVEEILVFQEKLVKIAAFNKFKDQNYVIIHLLRIRNDCRKVELCFCVEDADDV